jgi:hypothetical protein
VDCTREAVRGEPFRLRGRIEEGAIHPLGLRAKNAVKFYCAGGHDVSTFLEIFDSISLLERGSNRRGRITTFVSTGRSSEKKDENDTRFCPNYQSSRGGALRAAPGTMCSAIRRQSQGLALF